MQNPNGNGQPPWKANSTSPANSFAGQNVTARFLEFDCNVNPADFRPSSSLRQPQNPARVGKDSPYINKFRVFPSPSNGDIFQHSKYTARASAIFQSMHSPSRTPENPPNTFISNNSENPRNTYISNNSENPRNTSISNNSENPPNTYISNNSEDICPGLIDETDTLYMPQYRETCDAEEALLPEINGLDALDTLNDDVFNYDLFNKEIEHVPNTIEDLFCFEDLVGEKSSPESVVSNSLIKIVNTLVKENFTKENHLELLSTYLEAFKARNIGVNGPLNKNVHKYLVDQSDSSTNFNPFGSGTKKVFLCENYCCAYTGKHKNDQYCFQCSTPRSCNNYGWYISPIPIIRKLFLDPKICEILVFPHEKNDEYIRDVWDGDYIYELQSKGVKVNPYKTAINGKEIDVIPLFFGLVADSDNVFRSKDFEIMDTSLVLYNIPPSMRASTQCHFPLMVYPKRKFNSDPPSHSSFLQPIVDDFKRMEQGFFVRLGNDGRYVFVTCHLIYFNGDMLARSDAAGIVAPSGNFSCFNCYIPNSMYGGKPSFIKSDPSDPMRILQNTDGLFPARNNLTHLKDLQNANTSGLMSDANKKLTGINRQSPLLSLKTMTLEDSFPPDAVHLLFENLEREFFYILMGVPSGNMLRPCKNFPEDLLLNMEARYILRVFFTDLNESGIASKMMDRKFNLESFLRGELFNLTSIELKTILEIFPALIVLLDNVTTPKQREFL